MSATCSASGGFIPQTATGALLLGPAGDFRCPDCLCYSPLTQIPGASLRIHFARISASCIQYFWYPSDQTLGFPITWLSHAHRQFSFSLATPRQLVGAHRTLNAPYLIVGLSYRKAVHDTVLPLSPSSPLVTTMAFYSTMAPRTVVSLAH